ncbi:MAG: hypothetical protein PWP07_2108 [Epulopiscium sp.]|uniref:DUF4230 domain-containing protein n=1 Tax=Defluviitalea raffinosedens TaxID=1450156 RepID=A0A7C8HCY5_9FIRM|nr:DUF4230 domain-containing protein [Defluviitalea raffinosedens]KAE9628360.1 DUF4230 domain-containing protein [Defluviitalea raffinosedens]MBM7687131.1 hypothetical protein [Defluviitalea raffinosedens]MDK2788863.1 hypothetical protein [Candidatus Epulonipiscium sp.]
MGELNPINTSKSKAILYVIVLSMAFVAVAGTFALFQKGHEKKENAQIITVSTLEKIIKVSELSTFTAVYNGIAEVKNNNNPDQTDYFVSYEARVNAGIDFDKIVITVDDEAKTIKVDIPDAYITDINVDISSLDFIFYNQQANRSTITQEAFKACEADVREESEKENAILKLAQQNAVNVIKALVNPIIEQLDANYTLVIE